MSKLDKVKIIMSDKMKKLLHEHFKAEYPWVEIEDKEEN